MLIGHALDGIGDLKGIRYDFEQAGVSISLHTHPVETEHITIVARGSIKASGENFEFILNAGDMVNLPEGVAHEFVALEDNSRIFNIFKRYSTQEPT
jgi:quercetin dioxygenase-like cupin family protein